MTTATLTDLCRRAGLARAGFSALGTTAYVPCVEAQAASEGLRLTEEAKTRIVQIMGGNVHMGDADLLSLIERALEAQKTRDRVPLP